MLAPLKQDPFFHHDMRRRLMFQYILFRSYCCSHLPYYFISLTFENGMLKFVYYDWGVRQVTPAPWKVETVHLRPGEPPEVQTRIALKPERADAARIAKLLEQVRAGWQKPEKKGDPGEEKRYEFCEKGLNHLRNIGIGRPDEIIKRLEGLDPPGGAIAESIGAYLDQLKEVRALRTAEPPGN